MYSFEYFNPVKVIFGAGSVMQTGTEAARLGTRALLVSYEQHDFFADMLSNVEKMLKDNGVSTVSYYHVTANPLLCQVQAGVELAKAEQVDMVIGIGGGSAMDAAKVIAAGVKYSGNLWDMVASRHDGSPVRFPEEALPLLMIPTLPATGSEMNCCGVITNEKTNEKSYTWNPCLYPKVSIVDPQLTCSLPAYQTACGAADTISHVLEFYINGLEDTPLNNRIQEGVISTVIENIGKVLDNPNDLAARGHLQWASIVALNGISQPGNAWTPMHQVGHVLSARYNIAHGATLSIIMPAWMKHLHGRRLDRYVSMAENIFKIERNGKTDKQMAEVAIETFEKFLKTIGVPARLSEAKVDAIEIDAIVEDVVKVSFSSDGMLSCVPAVSKDDVKSVLELAI